MPKSNRKAKPRSEPPDTAARPLAAAIDSASLPVYLVGADRVVAYANAALGHWIGLPVPQVIGRRVEYHSEPNDSQAGGVLSGLCPPPQTLVGEGGRGPVSGLDQSGKLRRRGAQFTPLPAVDSGPAPVLVVLDAQDLPPGEPVDPAGAPQRLHAELLRLRRADAAGRLHAALVGDSSATRLLGRQVDAAVAGGANVLVRGDPADEPDELARLVAYRAATAATPLAAIDARLLPGEAVLGRVDRVARAEQPHGLLIGAIDSLADNEQRLLAARLAGAPRVRVLATAAEGSPLQGELEAVVAVAVLRVRPLGERRADMPLLCQWAVELANRGASGQVAGCSGEALDMLALFPWPGGVQQFRAALAEAHSRCDGPVILPQHLPGWVVQATLAAELPGAGAAEIDLDGLLGELERELITRALGLASDNKAEAARLLGMTRARFYRRLARLGLLPGSAPG